MHGTRPRRPTAQSVGRWLVLFAALAGLFAMHGMSDHGVAGPPALDNSSVSAQPMAAMDMALMTHADDDGAPADPGQGHDMGLMGLCLAVLAAVMAVGVLLGFLRTRAPGAAMPAGLLTLSKAVRERVPKPPDLFALSIQRC